MRTTLITTTAAGLLAVGGLAVAGPALAATSTTGTAVSSQVDRITQALAGLVSDGSITQAQADDVATTLDEADLGGGHGGGHGGGRNLATAATALGMSEEDLRTALEEDGATLASVAEVRGVAVDTLVAALVDAERTRIAQEVTDGDLLQAEADERLVDVDARITEQVSSTGGGRRHRSSDTEASEATADAAAA